jgi:hypothetical protein
MDAIIAASAACMRKQADPHGIAWVRFPLDDRFEHHDGTKVLELKKEGTR